MKKLLIIALSIVLFSACSNDVQKSSISEAMMKDTASSLPETNESEVSSSSSEDVEARDIYVIRKASISEGEHNVSADIILYSDNTLEITNFNYDGKAPDTYIAVGNIEDGKFAKVALISDIIEDKQENTTIILAIDDSLEFNAVSIWCDKYKEDFGSDLLLSVS